MCSDHPSNAPEAFSPAEAIAELVTSQSAGPGRRLSFPEKCSAFYALYSGARTGVVARAFGVTPTTASLLSGCLRAADRYREISNEWRRLGPDAFRDAYYTDEIHTRLMRAKHDVQRQDDKRTRSGPNRNANRYAFEIMGAFRGGKDWWRIDWTGPNEQQPFAFDGDAGWRFIDCHPNGGKIESSYEMPYQGMEALGQTNEPKPFANSKLAYDAVFKMIGD